MPIDAASLKVLIERELASLTDTRVLEHIWSLLVEPTIVLRLWDYGAPGDTYPCWIVLIDGSTNSGTGIAYCEYGFGPTRPWGLVWIEDDPTNPRTSMGMDSGWFSSFLDAYFESFAAAALPIWRVFRLDPDGTETPLTEEGELDATQQKCQALRSPGEGWRPVVGHSVSYKR